MTLSILVGSMCFGAAVGLLFVLLSKQAARLSRALVDKLRAFLGLKELNRAEARLCIMMYAIFPFFGLGIGYWALRGLFGGTVGLLAGIVIAKMRTTSLIEATRMQLERQLPVSIDLLISLMRGQLTLSNAVAELAASTPLPLRNTFFVLHRRDQLFTPLDQCFVEVAASSRSVNLRLLLSALSVFARQGGNAIEPLQQMSSAFKQILRLSAKIQTASAEAKGNFKTINGGALFIVGSIYISQPQLLEPLTETFIGMLVLAIAAAIWLGAVIWMRRLIRMDI